MLSPDSASLADRLSLDSPPAAQQARGKHPRIIDNNQLIPTDETGKIGELHVFRLATPAAHQQQSRFIPSRRWVLSD